MATSTPRRNPGTGEWSQHQTLTTQADGATVTVRTTFTRGGYTIELRSNAEAGKTSIAQSSGPLSAQ